MNETAQNYTRELAQLVSKTNFSDLPDSTVHATKRLILDTIACIMGSAALPSTKLVVELMQDFGGTEEATVLVTGAKLPSPMAAYINGYAANVLDAEETTYLSGHISGSLIPPALAIAERIGCSGRDLITAVAVGYEVAARVGAATASNMGLTTTGEVKMAPVHGHSWTSFGGTAAVVHLLGLKSEQLQHAFGLTGFSAPMPSSGHIVIQPPPRPMSKYAMYGPYAEVAVISGLLAAKNFTSDTSIFDGDNGLWRIIGSTRCDFERLTHDWGQSWLIEQVSYKIYPCCRLAHPLIDMAMDLQKAYGIDPQEIERIDVEMPKPAFSLGMHSNQVFNPIDAQFDLPYILATAMIGEDAPGPLWQMPNAMHSPKTAALANKVFMIPSPDSDRMAAEQIKKIGRPIRLPWALTITARGQAFGDTRQTSNGDPWAAAAYDDTTLIAKFRSYAELYFETDSVERSLAWLLALEDQPCVAFPQITRLAEGTSAALQPA